MEAAAIPPHTEPHRSVSEDSLTQECAVLLFDTDFSEHTRWPDTRSCTCDKQKQCDTSNVKLKEKLHDKIKKRSKHRTRNSVPRICSCEVESLASGDIPLLSLEQAQVVSRMPNTDDGHVARFSSVICLSPSFAYGVTIVS